MDNQGLSGTGSGVMGPAGLERDALLFWQALQERTNSAAEEVSPGQL
jgi:hypothetical protein